MSIQYALPYLFQFEVVPGGERSSGALDAGVNDALMAGFADDTSDLPGSGKAHGEARAIQVLYQLPAND